MLSLASAEAQMNLCQIGTRDGSGGGGNEREIVTRRAAASPSHAQVDARSLNAALIPVSLNANGSRA